MAGYTQMAIGAAAADSFTAFDPFERKDITYTFMVPYLKAFYYYAAKDKTDVSAVAIHPYGPLPDLRGLVELTHEQFKRPIWVTEFNHSSGSIDVAAARLYLIQTTDFLERSPYVGGYAWLKERVNDHANISLLAEEPGKLTELGKAYVAMPVHDGDLYYRVPGGLQAENYVTLENFDIWPTGDGDGFVHMSSTGAGAWLDFNIMVDNMGDYTLRLRVTANPGQIDIMKANVVLASVHVNPGSGEWETIETPVALPAGPQRIRIRCASAKQSVNRIEFTKP